LQLHILDAYTHHQVTVIKPITTIANVPSNNQLVNQSSSMILTGPLTSISSGLAKANVNHGVREVVLCKDANGKVGMRFREVDKGIFVQFVAENSPDALAGLRFGDQILQIDSTNMVGMSNDKVNDNYLK
jgi:syntenin-1